MKEFTVEEKAFIEYRKWLEGTKDDQVIQKELLGIKDDPEEIIDSFYQELEFGTSGIRGIIGPGTNRINKYVIRRVNNGFSNYLLKTYENPTVVVAYDSRKYSREFAFETAEILSGKGIKTYIFNTITPVSLLSFATRRLNCTMGVMITASHNPKIFNGYKVYNSEGYQIVGDEPDLILKEINSLSYFEPLEKNTTNVNILGDEIGEEFINKIVSFSLLKDKQELLKNIKIVYTPLNGTGNYFVREVLKRVGFTNIIPVPSQEEPDENFTTCPAPNPEKIPAFSEGEKVLNKNKADLIIATDPDSDRVGALINHDGMKVLMTGNQLGILVVDYFCHMKPPVPGQFITKSIVTTPFAERIAKKYGLKVVNTLTGFKYIGEIITELAKHGEENKYYLGFEESNGFLVNPFIRDKDGVSGTLVIAEMAAWLKSQGKDFIDRLEELYDELGVCRDKAYNFTFEGIEGQKTIKDIMTFFRSNAQKGDSLGGLTIIDKIDYLEDTDLPKSNVLSFTHEDGTKWIIRPSGTEPKLKIYFFAGEKAGPLMEYVESVIESFTK